MKRTMLPIDHRRAQANRAHHQAQETWLPSVADLHDLLIRSVVDYAIYMIDLEGRVVTWNAGDRKSVV